VLSSGDGDTVEGQNPRDADYDLPLHSIVS
jgi:hypothetical protein